MSDDQEIDNILANMMKKKGVKSGPKGKRTERGLVKVLNERFAKVINEHPDWGAFSRTIGSGNRWGQKVSLNETQMQVFSGDIAVPSHFRWTLESKGGYNDVDLNSAFEKGHRQIDEWITQVGDDSVRCGRKPMIVWKKDHKPRVVIMKVVDVPNIPLPYRMLYREWMIIPFEAIIKMEDGFFFEV